MARTTLSRTVVPPVLGPLLFVLYTAELVDIAAEIGINIHTVVKVGGGQGGSAPLLGAKPPLL